MTRAKKTLTLARFNMGHTLLDPLPESPELLRRPPIALSPPAPALARRYQRLTLKEVNIGFAGRARSHRVHRAIAALTAGDAITCRQNEERWLLLDGNGEAVGQLAQAFRPPRGLHCTEARVAAIIIRRKEDDDSQYRDSILCDRWEVVVPELIFEPGPTALSS